MDTGRPFSRISGGFKSALVFTSYSEGCRDQNPVRTTEASSDTDHKNPIWPQCSIVPIGFSFATVSPMAVKARCREHAKQAVFRIFSRSITP